jgi:hypothetical protein
MKSVIWTSMAVLSLVAFGACGGDDKKDGGTSVDTGLEDSKTLNALTQPEFQQFCDGLSNADQKAISKEDGCKSTAYLTVAIAAGAAAVSGAPMPTDADLQAACKTAYDQCMQATPQPTQKACQQDATCTATVGEAETCYAAGLKQATDGLKSMPSCSAITAQTFAPQDAGTSTTAPEPAECTAVKGKCPNWATVAAIPTG